MADTVDTTRTNTNSGWLQLTVSISLLTVAGLLAFALTLQYWKNRPINYTQHTKLLADEVETVLVEQFVPEQNIHRSTPERRDSETSTAYWNFYRFEVDLPPTLSPEGLKELVAAEMRLRNVNLVSVNEPGAIAAWSLGRGDLEFARVLLQRPTVAPIRQNDLRELSLSIADNLERALTSVGVAPETVIRSTSVEREDSQAGWMMTRFAAVLPPGYSPGELRADLEETLKFDGISLSTERVGYSTMVAVKYGERRFAEVLATPAPAMPEDESESNNEGNEELITTVIPPDPMEPETPDEVVSVIPPLEELESASPTVEIEEATSDDEATSTSTPVNTHARIAIILDDGGNNRAQSEEVLSLNTGLTLAILPHTPHGMNTAEEGTELGFEVMLHMPMETDVESARLAEGTVLTSMTGKAIKWQTEQALSSLTGVKGVNNHTGSKFTSDESAMRALLEVVKRHNLFFIDSWTNSDSIAYELAQEMGIRTAHRDVFLDHERTEAAIERQYKELVKRAKEKGSAIGIGHFQSPHTLALLKRELPKLKEQGIELVHASELVE